MKRIACRLTSFTLALFAFSLFCGGAFAQSTPQTYGTLFSYDFDTQAWTGATTEAVGTIDTLGSAQPSLAVRSSSLVTSGPLAQNISETNLGKLTLAFSLSASAAKPVTVTIQSYDSSKVRTGGLQTLVYPAAPDFYQRYAVDLSTCKPSGAGLFVPNAPFVSFSFSPPSGGGEVRVDDVQYALPAYYVSTTGSNSNTGRSEAQAFLTPQKALDMAQAGDIIDVMGGTYISPYGPSTNPPASYGLSAVAAFQRTGTPAAWISLKNYPGQQPTFMSNAWNIVALSKGYGGHPSDIPLNYLEVRGLHIRGEGDAIRFNNKYPDSVGQADSRSNSNGIGIDGRYMTIHPHHIRIADNFVEYVPGGGFGSGEADWVTFEGNISSNNCWPTIYAPSGISVSGNFNFDATDNVYKRLVRNNICYGNQTYQMWKSAGRYSDGNGIILDVNNGVDNYQGPVTNPDVQYIGRTLVQSNLSFNNGGSGIHSFRANRVDIIGNTTYLNSASPALQYAQISAGYADDVRIMNNILVAPVANTAAGEPAEPVNGNGYATNVVYSHNLYFGGNKAPIMGSGDAIGDPKFVTASIDPAVADFHLQATSPALAAGIALSYSPFLDLDGRVRGTMPDIGVYQLTQTTTALSSSPSPSVVGGTVTFTAAVTGSDPTGTVTFTDGATTLGTGTVTNGVATLSTSTLSVGSHAVTATYGGDIGNAPSTSSVLTQTVSAPDASVSVTSLSSAAAKTVTLRATLALTGGAALGGKTLTFSVDGTTVGTAITSGSGVAVRAYAIPASLPVGSHAITAAFAGDSSAGPASGTGTLTIVATPTLSGLSPASAKAGTPAFTLTVNGTGFAPNSIVKWKGASRKTTFVSATQLKAAISAADIAVAGTAAVTVTTPTVATTAPLTFTVTAGTSKPVLVSLSPSGRKAGGGAFTLTVTGTGFVPGGIVKWNGTSQKTTFLSATTLSATIPASLAKIAGMAQVTVTTPSVATSNALPFTLTP